MEIIELWTLRIEHNYYLQKEVREIEVQHSPEMKVLLMRRGLLWRRKKIGEWCLFALDDYTFNNEDILELEIVTTSSELPYITNLEWPVGNECYEMNVPVENSTLAVQQCATNKVKTRTPHCMLKLKIPIGQMFHQRTEPIATTLTFEAVSKYWEFLFIPRQPETMKVIRLEDIRKNISFGECEPTDFMGHKAYRIRSTNKLPLQESYRQIELVLWEKLLINDIAKERILLRQVSFPDPSLNLGTARDTVWRILYI